LGEDATLLCRCAALGSNNTTSTDPELLSYTIRDFGSVAPTGIDAATLLHFAADIMNFVSQPILHVAEESSELADRALVEFFVCCCRRQCISDVCVDNSQS
jgi:hypothetical protein